MLQIIQAEGDGVTPILSTGISATLLATSRTVQSTFKVPLLLNVALSYNLKLCAEEAKTPLQSKLIVWGRAPITYIHTFKAVGRLLHNLAESVTSFRRKFMLLGRDFRQVIKLHGLSPRANYTY
jgi:hypothetical protein